MGIKPKIYSERFDLRLNSFVKSKLVYLADKHNCSQGEIVRMAILNMSSQGEEKDHNTKVFYCGEDYEDIHDTNELSCVLF